MADKDLQAAFEEAQSNLADEARSEADAKGSIPRGYTPRKQRTTRISKALAGGKRTGTTKLDAVADDGANRKMLPNTPGVQARERIFDQGVSRLKWTPAEYAASNVNPETHCVVHYPSRETDRALGNTPIVDQVLRRVNHGQSNAKNQAYIAELDGETAYEGTGVFVAMPIGLRDDRDAAISEQRDRYDYAVKNGRWPESDGDAPDLEEQETEQRRRAEMAAAAGSPTKGKSIVQGIIILGGRAGAERVAERAQGRPPRQDGPPEPSKRTVFDMGRR